MTARTKQADYPEGFWTHGWSREESKQVDTPSSNGKKRHIRRGKGTQLTNIGDEQKQCTDLGNAERFVEEHGKDWRFCHQLGQWLGYREQLGIFEPDESARIVLHAAETARNIYRNAKRLLDALTDEGDPEKAKSMRAQLGKLLAWAQNSQNRPRLQSMIELAKSFLPVGVDDLDSHTDLLCVQNGIVDLRNGTLLQHSRDRFFTKAIPFPYDPDATAPRWAKFLLETMGGVHEMVDYLHRAAGYSITGLQNENCLFFLYGHGANGKSVFVNTLLYVLGPYAIQSVSDLLTARKNEQHPTELADLRGNRFVAITETEENKKLAESRLKQLTGGDRVRARRMRENFFEFAPVHTIWMSGNHKPKIVGTDDGIWRRLKLIHFAESFRGREDHTLTETLRAEAPGILAWLVQGCIEWRRQGLCEPACVSEAVREYRDAEDQIGRWLEECCERCDIALRAGASDLYKSYKEWAERGGETEILPQKAFGDDMGRRGFEKKKSDGVFKYLGIPKTGTIKTIFWLTLRTATRIWH